jgi:hypothetical protein
MSTPETITVQGAACRLYRDAPHWNGRKTAAVGGFRCDNVDAGKALLVRVQDALRSEPFEAVIGPMDGDTWHSYRLVAESDGSPPFLMEPVSGEHDQAAFAASGFAPISAYVSARSLLEDAIGPSEPVKHDDVTVTAWDGTNAEGLIGTLFDMSATRFSGNAFFKPMTKEAFLRLYQPILPLLDPRLILFARDETGIVGFLFGFPNRHDGKPTKTAILKTYASARHGVGHLLADCFHRAARDLGFEAVIHALMHVDNVSRQRSTLHGAKIFRRYHLMGRHLP